MTPCLVDANVLITPFSTPSLYTLRLAWGCSSIEQAAERMKSWFTGAFMGGHLITCSEVVDEVLQRNDRASQYLREWIKQEIISMVGPKQETFVHLAEIETFVRRHYKDRWIDEFTKGNDALFIALGRTYDIPLVTFEGFTLPQYHKHVGKIDGKARIPFIAWVFGVQCVPFYQLHMEISRFHL